MLFWRLDENARGCFRSHGETCLYFDLQHGLGSIWVQLGICGTGRCGASL